MLFGGACVYGTEGLPSFEILYDTSHSGWVFAIAANTDGCVNVWVCPLFFLFADRAEQRS